MSPAPFDKKNPPDVNTPEAVQNLFFQIQSAITKGNFAVAEKLREQLIAENPTALMEIIKSAELLDEAKAQRISKEHLAIWSDLYGSLSPEEKNCLYYSLKEVVVPPGKVLLSQGALNTRLFFIDSGQVTIYFSKGDKQTVLAQLGRGDILGEYTFTTISLCSATAVSHSEVHLRYLESNATDNWDKLQPGLFDKLTDFCIRFGRIDEIIQRKSLEKRSYTRYPVEGRISATVLTKDGQRTQTSFRGSLSDLSVAGTCFLIKCPKKSIARALLARHLYLSFFFGQEENNISFSAVGKVVAVSFHLYNDYSVHIRFTKHIKEEHIQQATLKRL